MLVVPDPDRRWDGKPLLAESVCERANDDPALYTMGPRSTPPDRYIVRVGCPTGHWTTALLYADLGSRLPDITDGIGAVCANGATTYEIKPGDIALGGLQPDHLAERISCPRGHVAVGVAYADSASPVQAGLIDGLTLLCSDLRAADVVVASRDMDVTQATTLRCPQGSALVGIAYQDTSVEDTANKDSEATVGIGCKPISCLEPSLTEALARAALP